MVKKGAVKLDKILFLTLFLLGVYLFVLALDGFKNSWGLAFSADGDLAQGMVLRALDNRLVAFFSGLVITTLLQSSSATVALVISTLGSGVISVETSIPMILGANLGTTVTNTIVALGHATRRAVFLKVVPAAIVDDIFKVYNVAIFFVLEMTTGFLQRLSQWVSAALSGVVSFEGSGMPDIIGTLTSPLISPVFRWAEAMLGTTVTAAGVLALLFFMLLLIGLQIMGFGMQHLFQETVQEHIHKVFSSTPMALSLGFVFTWILQSSSVATSLILPFIAHGHIQLAHVYHYSMGAAIGTTSDAGQIISYLKFGVPGVSAGLVHVAVNVIGVVLFLFIPGLRALPVATAIGITGLLAKSRWSVGLFIFGVVCLFYVVPLLVILCS